MKNITPIKLDFDNSFEMLSKNRKKLHLRRTLSGVFDLTSKNLHHKSFSSQLSSLSDDLQIEISRIKEEVEARCLEQKKRETMLESIMGLDESVQSDDVQVEVAAGRDDEVQGFFTVCRNWFIKCCKFVK